MQGGLPVLDHPGTDPDALHIWTLSPGLSHLGPKALKSQSVQLTTVGCLENAVEECFSSDNFCVTQALR